MKKDLSILIVNYNSKKYLIECLESLNKYLFDFSFEVIVVDNDSTDEKISAQDFVDYDFVEFVQSTKNLGFGAANNLAAQKANGEYLLLLNPDTVIVDNSLVRMFSFHCSHPEIAAMTCLLYQENGKDLQSHFFGRFQSLLGLTLRHYNYQKADLDEEFFYADIVTGGCLMIRKKLFEQIDGFDEKFFMYLEDDDLCKRLVNLGYKNAVYTKAKIIHLEGKSAKNRKVKKKYYYKSQNYYWQKHNGLIATAIMKIMRWPLKVIEENL